MEVNVFGKKSRETFLKILIDLIRAFIKQAFEHCGLDDPFGHFYKEMDSWKLWELDPNQERRTGIKSLAYEWLRQ